MRKYYQDDYFFEKIDTERKSYWLGFLYADGCVSKKNNGNSYLYIVLHQDDRYLIEEFIKDLKSNREVKVTNKGYVRLDVLSKQIGEDLIKLGCVPRKSKILEFPTEDIVPNSLIKDFIRGYMDGDGCISTYLKTKKGRKVPHLVCEIKFIGTYDFLNGLKSYFKSDKDLLINKHSPESCQISFAGRKYREVVDNLYEDATIYMKRKKLKWDQFINYIEEIRTIREDERYKKIVKMSEEGKYLDICNIHNIRGDFEVYSISRCCRNIEGDNYYNGYRWLFLENLGKKELIKNNCILENEKVLINQVNIVKTHKLKILNESKGIQNLKSEKDQMKESKVKKENIYTGKYSNTSKELREKKVNQYNLDGKFIRTWNSSSEIAAHYKTTAKAIRKVCNEERKSCYGFIWRYIKHTEWYSDQSNKEKEVIQFDLSENLIKVWPNIKEASKFFNVTVQSIRRACNGKAKTCCGFIWKHAE